MLDLGCSSLMISASSTWTNCCSFRRSLIDETLPDLARQITSMVARSDSSRDAEMSAGPVTVASTVLSPCENRAAPSARAITPTSQPSGRSWLGCLPSPRATDVPPSTSMAIISPRCPGQPETRVLSFSWTPCRASREWKGGPELVSPKRRRRWDSTDWGAGWPAGISGRLAVWCGVVSKSRLEYRVGWYGVVRFPRGCQKQKCTVAL